MDAASAREYELKLTGPAGAVRALESRVRKRFGRKLRWTEEALTSAYFDTRDQRLRTRGLSFRVRRKGRENKQTLKADGGNGGAALDRDEWEQAVPRFRPDPAALPAAALERLGLVLPGELRRLFTVEVARKKTLLTVEGTDGSADLVVELAIDRGTVKAGRKSERLAEVEMELVDGAPEALLDLALDLSAGTGLRIGWETKAGRGYRLVKGTAAPLPVHAARFPLTAGMTVNGALLGIFRHCLANVIANEPAVLAGDDPEGVHQMRVSLRRMRSALSVFGKRVNPERTAWLKNELQWLAGSLGPARDWDVFIAELLGDVGGYGIDPDALAEMARAAEVKRADGYAAARDAVLSERYTAFLLRMSSFVEAMGWVPGDAGGAQALETSLGANAKSLLNRPLRKLLADGAGLAEKTIAERHPVRIKLKRLRYAVDFLEGLYPAKRVRPFQKAMKRLQDDFGHLNDVAVAVGLVAELVSTGKTVAERRRLEKAAGLVTAWHARGVRDGEQSFLGDWKAFVRAKPFWRGKPAR